MTPDQLIDEVKRVNEISPDNALDVMFDWFDKSMHAARWRDIGDALVAACSRDFDVTMLVGFASISRPCSDMIERRLFIEHTERRLTELGRNVNALLGGLR